MSNKNDSPYRRIILVVVTLVATAIIGILSWSTLVATPPDIFYGLPYDKPEFASEFSLLDQHNNIVQLSDFRGKVVLLYFGFTHCPDACPVTFGIWNQVTNILGDNVDQVQFLFISVDPERDTPEQLGKHLSLFTADIVGLTGTLGEIEDVATDYSVFFKQVESESGDYYWVNHTTLTFVIDQTGQLVLAFPYAVSAEDIVTDLEHWLE